MNCFLFMFMFFLKDWEQILYNTSQVNLKNFAVYRLNWKENFMSMDTLEEMVKRNYHK